MTLEKQLERIVKHQRQNASAMHIAILSQIYETKTERVATNSVELLRVFTPIESPKPVEHYPNYNRVIDDVSDVRTSEIMTRILKVSLKPLRAYISAYKKQLSRNSQPKRCAVVDVSITDNHVNIRSQDTAQTLFTFDVKDSPNVANRSYNASNIVNALELISEQQRNHDAVQFGLKVITNGGYIHTLSDKFEYVTGSLVQV